MRTSLRLFGVAAVMGGLLRTADSFTTRALSPGTLAVLYLVTDILLLLGAAGIYRHRRHALGVAGTLGIVCFVVGILLVRIAAFGLLGGQGYELGATVALLGLAVLSVETLLRGREGQMAAILWLVALASGVVGTMGFVPLEMTILAGVAFGAGFVAAGRDILRG